MSPSLRSLRDPVVSTLTGLFAHGPTPLSNTLDYPGDPGILGPDSVSWRVLGDASVFVGGIRALVIQSAHAEVVAGVEDHSTYRSDPLGRLSRTSVYVTETTYGAMPEVEAAVRVVRHAHRPVHGTSERGRPYSAGRPEMAAWIANHPDRVVTNAQRTAISFLRSPPLSPPIKIAYRLLFNAALTTVPSDMLAQLGVEPGYRAGAIGRTATGALRWALGASPSWNLALVRCDAPIPSGLFRQPLPVFDPVKQ